MLENAGANEREEVTEEPQKKLSLGAIMELARKADEDVDTVEIDLEELGQDLRSKVDNIVDYIDACESRADSLRARVKQFETKARVLDNKVKRLKEYVAGQLAFDQALKAADGIKDDKPRISGHNFEISLRYSEQVEVKKEPNADLYRTIGKTFVRRTYDWNKPALKSAIKQGNKDVLECAALKKVPQIKINPKG